jgi:hypothetical protein
MPHLPGAAIEGRGQCAPGFDASGEKLNHNDWPRQAQLRLSGFCKFGFPRRSELSSRHGRLIPEEVPEFVEQNLNQTAPYYLSQRQYTLGSSTSSIELRLTGNVFIIDFSGTTQLLVGVRPGMTRQVHNR